MAKASEWQRYQLLKALFEQAIEDATWGMDEEVYHYLIFISKDEDEVIVFVNQSDAEQAALIEEYSDYDVETATSYEDAMKIAEQGFDLR
ncbi:MAG: hypothetical protein IKH15_09340 [Bacteroidales bacterium]|nr:hypothetical protein [Bacteroidales bacterium]